MPPWNNFLYGFLSCLSHLSSIIPTPIDNYTMESFKAFSQQLNPLAAKLSKQYSQAKQVCMCSRMGHLTARKAVT